MEKKAILIGASGLVGKNLLQLLLADPHYNEVLILVRRDLNLQHPKLRQIVLDFDRLNDYNAEITGNVVFCCLGTTKKQTPDERQYYKIDFQYPLDVAWMAYTNGAESYHFNSSIGADSKSSTFYTRTKGEAEQELKTIPFKDLHIYRPALLTGERKEKRLGEGIATVIMQLINPLLFGGLKKYRSIKAGTVAKAMLKKSLEDTKGVFTYESDVVVELSGENS